MSLVNDVITNPKTAGIVSNATMATGVATSLDWIPSDIGKLATLVGAILSTVLIVYWVQKIRNDFKRNKLDLEMKRVELEKMRQGLDSPDAE